MRDMGVEGRPVPGALMPMVVVRMMHGPGVRAGPMRGARYSRVCRGIRHDHGCSGKSLPPGYRPGGPDHATRLRTIAENRSAAMTRMKVISSSSDTVRYWNRFIAVSNSNPIPPAPTKPSTSDERIFSSKR